jgi:hypothetical protein
VRKESGQRKCRKSLDRTAFRSSLISLFSFLFSLFLAATGFASNSSISRSDRRPVYNEIIGTGQSLSTGLFANPPISTVPVWPKLALMTNLGVRQVIDRGVEHVLNPALITRLVPLVEARTPDHDGETIGAGMAYQINELALEDGDPPWPMVFSAHGVTGAPYAMLKRGTVPYRNSLETVKRVAAILDGLGMGDVVRAITVTHGETDSIIGTSATEYEHDLMDWRGDYDTDVRAITGQSEHVILFTDQMNTYSSRVLGKRAAATSPIPLAQLNAALDNPDSIVLVCPKYWLNYSPRDGAHLTNRSEELLGEKYGEAMARTFMDGNVWKPLYIKSANLAGATITLYYNVPTPPLVLDTTLIRNPGNFGFVYTDDSGAPPSILGVELSPDASKVRIRLSAMPKAAPGHRHIQYAYAGALRCGSGGCPAGPLTGPRGNLRDSDPLMSRLDGGDSIHLYNWAATQDFTF